MKIVSLFVSRHKAATTVVIVACILLQSCAPTIPTTSITGSWKDPEAKEYKLFFVAVLNKKLPVRSTIEGDLSKLLEKQGVEAAKSLDVLGKDEKIETVEEKKAAVEKIKSMNYDAIVTVTVLRHTEEQKYVKGTTSYTPATVGQGSGYYNPATGANQGAGNYGAFGVYYMDASTLYNTPGYYETDKVYFVQSNVYDAKSEKLVWSAQSETFYPGDLKSASLDFSLAMVAAMKEAGLIYKKE